MIKASVLFSMSTVLLAVGLVACGNDEATTGSEESTTFHVAALESGYGSEMWEDVIEAYGAANEDVTVKLTTESNLEEVIRPSMQAGDYPDVVLLAMNREEALTETLVRENGLENITEVLNRNVYGEEQSVEDKLIDGFTETFATNPYADGETYLAPMFYSPTGLFYNVGLLEEKGWDVPETWDEMWELGDKAQEEGIWLFTYATASYFDTLLGSMLYASGGTDFYNSVMMYEEGVWEKTEAKQVLETIQQLADYTHPDTVANANPNDFRRNQQLILNNEALFMPNGTWVEGEMEDAPREDNFEWGMMPVPSFGEGEDRYAFSFFEQIWVPSAAENKDTAKEFITYMYSEEAASIFLDHGAVQPIEGITDELEGARQVYYGVYDDENVLPAMGTFVSTEPVPGVSMSETLYGSIDSIMNDTMTVEQWQNKIQEANDQLKQAVE
ncbi:carbohydrate ABC transporter substrate-binding protein [Alteribacter populi]|uniref:carbohydrate ABC transporter substrate-binding protein n=1 Tax=Alteribacter populi TaxID=2011011 RepID=UPI001E51D143|nr:carbohydrate ABC transporter substrate-binding protein [Alteribacter populi]